MVAMTTRASPSGGGVTDHGALTGLSDDDHSIYSLADGTRDFTGKVIGVDPTSDQHLATKIYVDSIIADDIGFTSTTGGLAATDVGEALRELQDEINDINSVTDHGNLTGLSDDDHTQYSLADGTRDFTGKVIGVDPTADQHLATKLYVDSVDADTISFTSTTGGIAADNVGDALRELQDEILDVDGSLYPLLLGRAGGQTLIGGLDSGDDLVLQSTSDATEGSIFFDNQIVRQATDPGWNSAHNVYQLSAESALISQTSLILLSNLYIISGVEKAVTTDVGSWFEVGPAGGVQAIRLRTSPSATAGETATMTTQMSLNIDGSMLLGVPTGGAKGTGTLNAQAVYDDNVILTCYPFDAYLDGNIDEAKWDSKVPNRDYKDSEGNIINTEIRTHEPMRKFKTFFEGKDNPLDIDAFISYFETTRHLTSYPDEATFDPLLDQMSTGGWIQCGIEADEILAIHIAGIHKRLKALEGAP